MALQEHPIFVDYPITGTRTNWYGKVSTPYRVYDGYGVMLGGTCDVTAARHMLRNEQALEPAITVDRRALMAMWIANFTDASVGPHTELQFSLFVSRAPRSDIPYHPFVLLKIMLENRELPMLVHGLWNDTDAAIGYNRDLLGLDAQPAVSAINAMQDNLRFAFSERSEEGSMPIASGTIKLEKRTGIKAGLSLSQLMGGFSKTNALLKQPYSVFSVMNRVSQQLPRNVETEAAAGSEHIVLREWNRRTDQIDIKHPYYGQVDFQPDFVQQFTGARFVYVTPRPLDVHAT